jgi:hypothetical protein
MGSKKKIKINSSLPLALIFGLSLGCFTVFIVEHYSTFSFREDTSSKPDDYGRGSDGRILMKVKVDPSAPVLSIHLKTPFGSGKMYTEGVSKYNMSDVMYKPSSFYSYNNKLKYYIDATLLDYIYIIYFGLGYALVIFFIFNFKLEFT